MNALKRYFTTHLHRRIFAAFGVSILVTGTIVAGVLHLLNAVSPHPWQAEWERAGTFVMNQFAQRWDDPAARAALIHDMERDLKVNVVLRDTQGNMLSGSGACEAQATCQAPGFKKDVVALDGSALGTISVCGERDWRGHWLRLLLALTLTGALLWGASGKLARRIAKPLEDLARVAQDLGAGNLAARVTIWANPTNEVVNLAHTFNDMAAKIEKQMADQRELLASVSHELRTPLARLRILAELARDSAGTRIADDMDREVVELDSLVGDLLANSRLEFHALTVRPLRARDVVERALERTGTDPACLVDETRNAELKGDATLLARALSNIIENARHHGKGLRTLRIRQRDGFVAFDAEDAGDGFAPGEETRLFGKFVYSDREPGKERLSLGLGLALVKRIAESHGGTAYAHNLSEGGARVGFEVAVDPVVANS